MKVEVDIEHEIDRRLDILKFKCSKMDQALNNYHVKENLGYINRVMGEMAIELESLRSLMRLKGILS